MKTILSLFLFFLSINSYASVYDLGDGSSFMQSVEGNTYRVKNSDTVTIGGTPSGSSLSVTEKVNIPTSKGSMALDLKRTVPVDVARVGKAFAKFAIASGPVGMALSIAELVCDLSQICKNETSDGWLVQTSDASFDLDASAPGSILYSHDTLQCPSKTLRGVIDCVLPKMGPKRQFKSLVYDGTSKNRLILNTHEMPNFPNLYGGKIAASNGYLIPQVPAQTVPATQSDWDNALPKLNDYRFIEELLNKFQPIPVSIPTITTPQKLPLGSETTTTKDSAGNTTGTETKSREAEITQPTPAENPTNSPTIINITENTTINRYNTNNELTSSTSTKTDERVAVPESLKMEPITISIDDVPDTNIQTVDVPGVFSFISWGSGSCPAPKTWATSNFGTHEISYQLTCDFAEMARPIILLIAAIASFMIVASIRTD